MSWLHAHVSCVPDGISRRIIKNGKEQGILGTRLLLDVGIKCGSSRKRSVEQISPQPFVPLSESALEKRVRMRDRVKRHKAHHATVHPCALRTLGCSRIDRHAYFNNFRISLWSHRETILSFVQRFFRTPMQKSRAPRTHADMAVTSQRQNSE